MSDPRKYDRAALGGRARELMQSPVFNEAIAAVHVEYQEALFASKPEDSAKREALYLEYHALKRVVSRLHSWEADGVMAQREIEAEK